MIKIFYKNIYKKLMKFFIKFLLKFYDELFVPVYVLQCLWWVEATEFFIEVGLLREENLLNLPRLKFCARFEGKHPYRGPAGRLDTLHVFSERGGDGIFYKKAIEGPSSYSYI